MHPFRVASFVLLAIDVVLISLFTWVFNSPTTQAIVALLFVVDPPLIAWLQYKGLVEEGKYGVSASEMVDELESTSSPSPEVEDR